MKTQTTLRETGTFEDMIFEGRNKSYGAFDLNRKRNRFMLTAFLISLAGISTCIAVPFFNALKGDEVPVFDEAGKSIRITLIKPKTEIPPPPKPPEMKNVEKMIARFKPPLVVEDANEDFPLMTQEDLRTQTFNQPIEPEVFPDPVGTDVIPEPEVDTIVLFPSEPASFKGGDLNTFRKWVSDNMEYPEEAQRENVFGKVIIEFCVNKKGEVVETKVLRSLHPSVDEATIEVISSSPRWTPAKQGGNPVKTKYIIPFMFDLI